MQNYDGCTDGDGQNPPIDKGCVLITPLAAIKEAVSAANADSSRSAPVTLTYELGVEINSTVRSGFSAAVKAVQAADVAVLVMGITTCSGGFGVTPLDCIEGEMVRPFSRIISLSMSIGCEALLISCPPLIHPSLLVTVDVLSHSWTGRAWSSPACSPSSCG